MGSGRLDQMVTLRTLTRTSDGAGGVTETWSDFPSDPTIWAAVTFKSAKEDLQGGRVNATQVTNFEIFSRSDVSELDALIWEGETYNIRAVRRYGGHPLTMWIDAERGVAN